MHSALKFPKHMYGQYFKSMIKFQMHIVSKSKVFSSERSKQSLH